jgi:hypothetical protein
MARTFTTDKTRSFFPWLLDGEQLIPPEANTVIAAKKIKAIHDSAEQVLFDWLDNPPSDWRQMQALNLLADAIQLLHSSCINLDVILEAEPEK